MLAELTCYIQTLLTNGLLPSVKEDEYFHEALRTFGQLIGA